MSADPLRIRVGEDSPIVHETAWVAPGAVLTGRVELQAGASVWYNAVLRGDSSSILVGENSNLQDGVVVHVDASQPVTLGRNVSVGHNAVIHGATIEDNCLIGMSATLLNGSVIGEGSLVAAGALVTEGMLIPPGSLVAGVPAKVRRALSDEERMAITRNAEVYLAHVERHRSSSVL